jgi:hypothetical protein
LQELTPSSLNLLQEAARHWHWHWHWRLVVLGQQTRRRALLRSTDSGLPRFPQRQ